MACFFLQLPLYVVFKPSLPLFQVMTTKKTNLIFSTANQMMPPLMSNWPKPPCEVCEVYAYFLLCISCRDKSIILPSFCCNRIFAYFGCETNSLHNLIGSSVRRGFNALKAQNYFTIRKFAYQLCRLAARMIWWQFMTDTCQSIYKYQVSFCKPLWVSVWDFEQSVYPRAC